MNVSGVLSLAALAMQFGEVERITYHADGRRETDTTHTVMLSLIACAFAEQKFPELDLGRVAQFALIHDLVEAYAGDTPTLRINDEIRADKRKREDEAAQRITEQFERSLPWVPRMVAEYEAQIVVEARYVRAMDKLMPPITELLSGHASRHHYGGLSMEDLQERYALETSEIEIYAADLPELRNLRAEVLERFFESLTSLEVVS